jgi:chromosome segregation ATPase
VLADVDKLDHKPKPAAVRSSHDDYAAVAVLTERIADLKERLDKAEANFAAERGRCDALMAEMLKATADLMATKQASARLEGELAALKARPWWRRLAG